MIFLYINKSESNIYTLSLYIALFAVILNFIIGKLFKARERMYRKKGFSYQRSKAQAYSNARMGHILSALA